MKNLKQKKKLFILAFLCLGLAFAVFFAPLALAADLNLKVTANLNGFNTDFYAITNSNALRGYDGYDMGSQPLQTNDSRLFSWCNPGTAPSVSNSTCSLVIDSWPASSRTLYLAYRFNPASSGTLNLTWNSSTIGSDFTAALTDYGTNNTYSSGAAVSSAINMKANSSYSANFSGWRYFTMSVTYNPPGGGEEAAAPACSPNCDCAVSTCVGSTCSNGCDGTCSGTKQPDCGSRVCGNAPNGCGSCGTCKEDEICSSEGQCKQTECSLFNPCRDEDCIDNRCENNQCVPYFTSGSCDDGDDCTTGDRCDRGVCRPTGIDELCEEELEPPADIDDEIRALAGTGGAGAGCTIDINQVLCGAWSKCEGQYDISGLISGAEAQIEGLQTRKCTDSSHCLPDYTESEECVLKEEVTVKDSVWCEEEYTEIVNSEGDVVARMKKTSGGESVSVDLNAAGNGYCAYCYNAAKDGDEEGVDCGGSCDECGVSTEAYQGTLYNLAQLAVALGFFLFFTSSFIFVFADFALYIKNIFLLKRLGGKFSYWRKEGYDVDVLERDLSKMEKAFEYKVHKHK